MNTTFHGVYDEAELYTVAFSGPVDDELDWLLSLAPETRSVLEPFCGQARFAEAFVRRGVTYFGIDRCPSMLALAPHGPSITLVTADAASFDLERQTDLAWCPINSLCHLPGESDIRSHLACVHRHLVPGSPYVIEMEIFRHDGPSEAVAPDRSAWTVARPDGTHVDASVSRESCDLAARTCIEHARYRHRRGDTVIRESAERFVMRMWTYDDLLHFTRQAGFKIERVFRNKGSRGRPEVQLRPEIENDTNNHYFLLRSVI